MTTKQIATKPATKRATKPTASEARRKALAASGVRITKPGAGRVVGMPEAVNEATSGVTFATWKNGDDAKRRAWNGGAWLAVDTRDIDAEAVANIAAEWNAKATATGRVGVLAVFVAPNAKSAK